MSRNKVLWAALALLILVSVALALSNVSAGDENGGLHHMIRALL